MSSRPDKSRRLADRSRSARMAAALCILSAGALLFAGCGSQKRGAEGNSRSIACGPLGAPVRPICTVEAQEEQGTLHLTLRQPEGGFRRLVWPRSGALSVADGAEPLETMPLAGGGVEVRIGSWRYRIERKGGGLP